MQTSAAVFIGAGFSHVAGLPLTKELFQTAGYASSSRQLRHMQQVIDTWSAWRLDHPNGSPDEFFFAVYKGRVLIPGVPWGYVIEALATILSQPVGKWAGRNVRYANRLTRKLRCPEHVAFWSTVLNAYSISGVLTTNYDLLAEGGLRHRRMRRPPRPGFNYAGLPFPQVLKGTAQPFSIQNQLRTVSLDPNGVPLCKLHGSLNWAEGATEIDLFQDCRAAFRSPTKVRLVPPLHEIDTPDWLNPVWQAATRVLKSVHILIACGYSFPAYDVSVRRLFVDSLEANGNLHSVHIVDPNAATLKSVFVEEFGFRGHIDLYSNLADFIKLFQRS